MGTADIKFSSKDKASKSHTVNGVTIRVVPNPSSLPPRKLAGDMTEEALSKIGITQDRYKQFKNKFGLMPTCNCTAKKQWINKVHQYFLDFFEK